MFTQLTTLKLVRFGEELNNKLVYLLADFAPENNLRMGVSKELYEQLAPLDDEKPDKRLEKLYETFKPFEGKGYYKQADLFVVFDSDSLEDLARR